ncbi:MAG: bifunctional phosphopantothenoylcysteine decarboxylase/phosphopantothenate--cysteine ligase CoaBC [Candidatus Aminicenantes bacterium]|nr:bifunctional phosphopantothenoylcysteine decarboxylase/phosphopantothenate--cysteine ligase CoaBC [Candidatus Aminicenantes bacterium]
MQTIVLGICSSISIYKSCDILRGFQKKGFRVQVLMTKNATHMISPLLFSALSGQKVFVDSFDEGTSERINHVDLAKDISLLVIAPATANMIGKLAGGVADDFLSTFYLAARSPVLIAPAMNEAMYFHKQTKENIQKLRAQGVRFVEPDKGYLACEDEGWGRLASPGKIVEDSLNILRTSRSLEGKKVIVTAGPTREHLDPVRFISNRSSGKMGFELADEAHKRGAEVVLITGPTHLFPPKDLTCFFVQSAEEMNQVVHDQFPDADILIMAAAVSDYMFSNPMKQKIKKSVPCENIQLVPTVDILSQLSRTKNNQICVGFAAETENIEQNALSKLKKKKLDLIVANDVSEEGIGFDADDNKVSLFFPDGDVVHTDKKSKLEISRIILDEIEGILGRKSS